MLPMLSRLTSVVRFDLLSAALLAVILSSCKSTSPKIEGVPSNLPNIGLYGSARTPSHNMARADYPFDEHGNYVTAWAAEDGSAAGPSDYQRRRLPDRDDPPSRRSSSSSSTRRVNSTPVKKVASSSSSKKKSSSSSGSSVRVTVKSSDTLWGLARKYGTSVAKIKAANGLKSDVIRNGKTLVIPR